jgi:hypothetical protein
VEKIGERGSTIFLKFVSKIDQKENKISEDWEAGYAPAVEILLWIKYEYL